MFKRSVATVAVIVSALSASAQWTSDSTSNTAVCVTPANESIPVVISDANGGVIVGWSSAIAGHSDGKVWLQRFDSAGNALWTTNGVELLGNAGQMTDGRMIPDGAGGAFVASGNWLQRIGPDGKPLWNLPDQLADNLISDGAGGVIALWQLWNSDTYVVDTYVQRFDAEGQSVWPSGARQITVGRDTANSAMPISDGAGGAIISWFEWRYDEGPYGKNLYVQRIDGAGNSLWQPERAHVNTENKDLHAPILCLDQASGVYVIWHASDQGIRAQHLDNNGAALWASGGIEIVTGNVGYVTPTVATGDGAGGFIASWIDTHDTLTSFSIRAQRIDPSGALQWQPDGVLAGSEGHTLYVQHILSDGQGGVVLFWGDSRRWDPSVEIYGSLNSEIYAQRFAPDGTKLWAEEGTTISIADNHRYYPRATRDTLNAFVVCWVDERNKNDEWGPDIYGTRIDMNGAFTGVQPPANRTPIANTDSYEMDEGGTLIASAPIPMFEQNVGVLYNDFDEEGTPLVALVKTLPAHGSLNLQTSGTFVYVPAPGYFGQDSFTYEASDGALSAETTATIWIDEICGPYHNYDPGNCTNQPELSITWTSAPLSVSRKSNTKVTGQLRVSSLRNDDSQNTIVRLYLSDDRCWDENDRLLKTLPVKNLQSTKSKSVKVSLKLPRHTPDGKYLIAWINPDYRANDCNLENNLQTIMIVPNTGPLGASRLGGGGREIVLHHGIEVPKSKWKVLRGI